MMLCVAPSGSTLLCVFVWVGELGVVMLLASLRERERCCGNSFTHANTGTRNTRTTMD